MVCLNCPPNSNYLKGILIDRVVYDQQVKPGDTYHIYVDVIQKSLLLGDYGRVCIYDGDDVIAKSKSFYLKINEKIQVSFSGIMPDRDLYLNASLVDEQIYGFTNCADGRTIHIKQGTVTLPIDPIPDEPGVDDDDGDDDESILDWLMDNIVLVLSLLIVIILLMKFG